MPRHADPAAAYSNSTPASDFAAMTPEQVTACEDLVGWLALKSLPDAAALRRIVAASSPECANGRLWTAHAAAVVALRDETAKRIAEGEYGKT